MNKQHLKSSFSVALVLMLILGPVALVLVSLDQYWFNVLTPSERQSFINIVGILVFTVPIFTVLYVKFVILPHGKALDQFEQSFERRFAKYPTLQALMLTLFPFGIGCAISGVFVLPIFRAFGIRPPEAHQLGTIDYVSSILGLLFWIGLTIGFRNHLKQKNLNKSSDPN